MSNNKLPETADAAFQNFLFQASGMPSLERQEELIAKGLWTREEFDRIEANFNKQKDIYSFLQEASGNPYIKILKEGERGGQGDINRPYYHYVPDAVDTIGVFEHKLQEDYGQESGHAFQHFLKNTQEIIKMQEESKSLLDSLGGDYEELYNVYGSIEEEIHGEDRVNAKIDSLLNLNKEQPFSKEVEGETFLDMITKMLSKIF